MSGDTDNPRIWLNGDVLVAPVGTTAPTDIETAWNAAYDPLGLLSEDGLTETRDNQTTDHYAWGGILVRTTRSQHKRTFTVTALEDNPVVRDLVDPGYTSTTTGGVTTRVIKVPGSNVKAFGVEKKDGSVTKRIAIPRAEVEAVADVASSESEMSMYELTIAVYPDGEGVLYHEITDDPQADESGS